MRNIKFAARDGAGIITLSRPKQMNAVNIEMLGELKELVVDLKTAENVKCVVMTGEGDRAFAAGADICEMKDMSQCEAQNFSRLGSGVMNDIENLGVPVIAAVNGYALGGGCELSLCCDIRIAAENAVFGQPEVTLGITPGFGGTQRLPRIVGQSNAMEMILTGNSINAEQALKYGLVNKVVPKGGALTAALSLAKEIMKNPFSAVRSCRNAVLKSAGHDIENGLAFENKIFSRCFECSDQLSRMASFLNERKK